jgi:hypothetical protein
MLSGSETSSEMNVAVAPILRSASVVRCPFSELRAPTKTKSHTAELPSYFVPNPVIGSSHQSGRLDVLRFAFRVVVASFGRKPSAFAAAITRARASPAEATVVVEGVGHGAEADPGGSCHIADRRPEWELDSVDG